MVNKHAKVITVSIISLCLLFSCAINASNELFDTCVTEKAKSENKQMTLKELNSLCKKIVDEKSNQPAVERRFNAERKIAYHPFVITPHKKNYLLPLSYTDSINQAAYNSYGNWSQSLDDIEAKLQISFKVPLLTESLFNEGDGIAFGFTLQSWWQMYNHEISRPFRETNYNPDFFILPR